MMATMTDGSDSVPLAAGRMFMVLCLQVWMYDPSDRGGAQGGRAD